MRDEVEVARFEVPVEFELESEEDKQNGPRVSWGRSVELVELTA